MSARVAANRAKRGERFLDERFPGWTDRIDPSTLNLASGADCICGQAFRGQARQEGTVGFSWAVENLFSESVHWLNRIVKENGENRKNEVSVALGFQTDSECSFQQLQEAWLNLLKRRKERESLPPKVAVPALVEA